MGDFGIAITAEPIDRNKIRKDAYMIREKLGLKNQPFFPIMKHLELVLFEIDPLFYVQVVEEHELKGRFAEALPNDHLIRVKRSVYDAACADHPWARIIMAHELAHYMYHPLENMAYAKADRSEQVPVNFNPEYQADMFAAELLMPLNLIKNMRLDQVMRQCAVTKKAAANQLKHANQILNKHNKKVQKRHAKKEKTARLAPYR